MRLRGDGVVDILILFYSEVKGRRGGGNRGNFDGGQSKMLLLLLLY